MAKLEELIRTAAEATAAALSQAVKEHQDETYNELFQSLRGLGRAGRAIKQETHP